MAALSSSSSWPILPRRRRVSTGIVVTTGARPNNNDNHLPILYNMQDLVVFIQSTPRDPTTFGELELPGWKRTRIWVTDVDGGGQHKILHVGECAQWDWYQGLNVSHITNIMYGVEIEGCEFFDENNPQKGGYGARLLQFFDELNKAMGVRACEVVDASEKTVCSCDTYSFAELRRLTSGQSWYNAYAFLPEKKGPFFFEGLTLDQQLADFNGRFREAQALLQRPASRLAEALQASVNHHHEQYLLSQQRATAASLADMDVYKARVRYKRRAALLTQIQPILAQVQTYQQFFQLLVGRMFGNDATACRIFELLKAYLEDDRDEPFSAMRRIWQGTSTSCIKTYKDDRGLPLEWEFRKSPVDGLFTLVHRVRRTSLS